MTLFNSTLYVCPVTCGEPPTPATLFMVSSTGRNHGDTVKYQCLNNLHLEYGDMTAECYAGVWTWIPNGKPAYCGPGKIYVK